jgi:hypothetical protein
MTFDPVIQKYMSHFYDVHGTLHITIKPDLTKALGWADPKVENGEPFLKDSIPVCLDINYDNDDCEMTRTSDLVIKLKSKAQNENVETNSSPADA